MPEVNNSEMVRYRGGSALPQTKSRRLIPTSTTDSSSNSNNGGEDWITRKRVQTKTTKNIEKRVQRQVVLEDGRIIEEGEPEVTVDTVEDVESHSDDGEEDRHIVGGWSRQFHPDRALQAPQPGEGGSTAMSAWHPGGNVLGETLKRNTHVNDVKQHSYSTTSARNLGDISSRDVKKIISEGRSTRTFIKPLADNETPVDIPTKMTHKNASRKRMVDTENIEEVQRIQDGAVKTDRFVTRESIQDDNEETPSEGSSTDSESNDGDRDSFSQRKEDRYIDYYTVPRGKSIKEGKFLRHGIHLTSYDKSNKAGELEEDSVRRPALPYKGDSDSTGDMWAGGGGGGGMPNQKKPPISDRPPSRSRSNGGTLHKSHRYSSTERESTSPGRSSSQFPVHYSKPIPRGGGGSGDHQQKYHTIERGSRGPSVDSNRFYHTTNTGFGGGSDRRQLSGGGGNKRQQQVAAWQRHSMAAAGHDSDSSYSRSRSESRGQTTTQPLSMAPRRSNLKKTNHHSSMGALKTGESSVDGPATSSSGTTNLMRQGSRRLKRAMSFTGESGRKPRSRSGSIGSEAGKSLIGSFKSLYASLTKTGGGSSGGLESKKEKENRVSAANKAWFDQGTPDGGAVHGGATAAPQRPPRKARSTASSMTSGQDMYSSYNKRQNKSTNNLNADYNRPLRSHTGTLRNSSGVGGSSFDVRDKGGASRSWEVYSSNNNLNSGYSTGGGGGSPTTNHSTISKSSFQRKRQPSPLRKLSPFRRKGSSQGDGSTSKALQQQQPPKASATRHSQADDRHSSPARSDIRNGRQSSLQSDRRRTSPARSDLRSTHLVGGRSEHKRGGGSDMDDNREPRRFEEDRQMRQRGQVRSRFFGQQDGVGGDGNFRGSNWSDLENFSDGGGGHGSNSVRPPPDMRRLLLNNVNLSRSKSMSKDLDQQRPSVIRAI